MAESKKADFSQSTWKKTVARYARPDARRASWQLVNTLVPYLALWYLMIRSLEVSYLLTLLLAVLAAGLLMRIFIIFHDCGHGSFFRSKTANAFWGNITGILTFTPYENWRHEHAVHHATSGDLDRRGRGDVWTMTVKEFVEAPWHVRAGYRVFRHPFFMLLFGPFFSFIIMYRFSNKNASRRIRINTYITNLALLAIVLVFSSLIGFKAYLMIQLPVIVIGGSVGIWMFYVQHQFEPTYWEHHEEWDFLTAALYGSSYYRLPKIFQWFTGNIGLHHIHHLSPRIPNYHLQPCMDAEPLFQIEGIGFRSSLRSLRFRLWDEDNFQLVGFDHLKTLKASAAAAVSSAGD